MLEVIIVNFNTARLLEKCLKSMLDRKWQNKISVCVVDNGSSDNSTRMVNRKFPQVKLIKSPENLGFSAGNNLALKNKKMKADCYLLLNSDAEVLDESLDKLVDFAKESDYGIISCKLVNKDGSFQPNAGDLPLGMALLVWIAGLDDVLFLIRRYLPSFHRKFKEYYRDNREVGWVSGSVMLIKREVIEKIGYLDDAIFMYGEDVEYCMRAKRAGFKVGWTNEAQFLHLGGASSKDPSFKQWAGEIKGLLYIYKKYFGLGKEFLLRVLIDIFIGARIVAFYLIGRPQVSKAYAKVLSEIK